MATKGRRAVFSDIAFGLTCVELLRKLRRDTGCAIYAYCLMPDHVHLLIGTVASIPLSRLLGSWKSRCCRAAWGHGITDTFWQRSFYDHAVRTNQDLRAAAAYVLGNPVRAGIVADFHEYPLCGSMEFDL